MAVVQAKQHATRSSLLYKSNGKELTTISEREIDTLECSSSDSDTADDASESSSIVASPYCDPKHRLDLRTLSNEVANFAQALSSMDPIAADYATAPYELAFNWDIVLSEYSRISRNAQHSDSPQLRFYVIVFRSRLKADADRQLLGTLDKAAHLEAVQASGLLKYWFGFPDVNGRNLATCLWRARSDARSGGAGPGHAAAMLAAGQMYDEWFVERLELSIDTRRGSWRFNPWPDVD